jgi:hypothetical protein
LALEITAFLAYAMRISFILLASAMSFLLFLVSASTVGSFVFATTLPYQSSPYTVDVHAHFTSVRRNNAYLDFLGIGNEY